MTIAPEDVIKFWFEETSPRQWYMKDPAFDALISEKFGAIHRKAACGELSSWRSTALGALAEVIVLDQFSRNMHRGKPEAFASDSLALQLAEEAIEKKFDKEVDKSMGAFFYMPFMHSESADVHKRAVELFKQDGYQMSYAYELKHKDVIDKFGRYPHRNETLGRDSTAEELEFLKGPDSSF